MIDIPNGPGPFDLDARAVSDGRFKLVAFDVPVSGELLFDLAADPQEQDELLQSGGVDGLSEPARDAYLALSAELDGLRTELVYDAPQP